MNRELVQQICPDVYRNASKNFYGSVTEFYTVVIEATIIKSMIKSLPPLSITCDASVKRVRKWPKGEEFPREATINPASDVDSQVESCIVLQFHKIMEQMSDTHPKQMERMEFVKAYMSDETSYIGGVASQIKSHSSTYLEVLLCRVSELKGLESTSGFNAEPPPQKYDDTILCKKTSPYQVITIKCPFAIRNIPANPPLYKHVYDSWEGWPLSFKCGKWSPRKVSTSLEMHLKRVLTILQKHQLNCRSESDLTESQYINAGHQRGKPPKGGITSCCSACVIGTIDDIVELNNLDTNCQLPSPLVSHVVLKRIHQFSEYVRLLKEKKGKGMDPIMEHSNVSDGQVDEAPLLPNDQYYLTGMHAYLLDEPCIMCTMALLHSRISGLFVFQPSSYERKDYLGRCDSDDRCIAHNRLLNHSFELFYVNI